MGKIKKIRLKKLHYDNSLEKELEKLENVKRKYLRCILCQVVSRYLQMSPYYIRTKTLSNAPLSTFSGIYMEYITSAVWFHVSAISALRLCVSWEHYSNYLFLIKLCRCVLLRLAKMLLGLRPNKQGAITFYL